jgi:hypothetical protein
MTGQSGRHGPDSVDDFTGLRIKRQTINFDNDVLILLHIQTIAKCGNY